MKNKGLTASEAKARLEEYGANELVRFKKVSPLKILLSQFTSPLMILLIGAAVVSELVGIIPGQDSNTIDTLLIIFIVLASGVAGFIQEYKTEKTIEALKNISTPQARVIRDGAEITINRGDIVPGDVIVLEDGDVVPADAKILESTNLEVDESILTGESKSVKKYDSDYVYMNTSVFTGHATALVTSTGMKTKMGEIAGKLQEIQDEKTPFQKEMAGFGKKVFWIVIAISMLIFAINYFKYGVYESLLIAISLSVAAIPEGLPAVITLALSIGAKSMFKENALIKKLGVTESIGAVSIICTDKTGTLTENDMTVTKIFLDSKTHDATKKIDDKDAKTLMLIGALCNNSKIGKSAEGKKIYLGDQTEIALRKAAEKYDVIKEEIDRDYKRVSEVSFTSDRKMMTVVCENKSKNYAYSKGAPEVMIEACTRIIRNGKITALTKSMKDEILDKNKEFSSKALRVLGFAYKEMTSKKDNPEKALIWVGLQAMIDPPREGIKEVMKEVYTAGIRVVMLTGDNPMTAKAIADDIGLKSKGIITGFQLENLTDVELEKKLGEDINIFARISPFHKLRILESLKKHGHVAMTGDGVNDAMVLKKADVGIAMGIRGTEVAKEASDIILLDDNFATIRTAIKEGRRIFDNIRKFVNYLFTCNIAEVGVILLATIFLNLKDPILLPVQLLWINLLTDGLPALAFGIDPARKNIMLEAPRPKNDPIINNYLMKTILSIGVMKMVFLFATFALLQSEGFERARTILFTGFVLYEFVRIATIRYSEKLGWLTNKWLIGAVIGSILLHLFIIYSPLNAFFYAQPIDAYGWAVLVSNIVLGFFTSILITKIIMKFSKKTMSKA